MEQLKIAVLDHNHVASRCVQLLLVNHFDAEVYVYDNTNEFLADNLNLKVDLVIAEYNMPVVQGDKLFSYIEQNSPKTKILFWSTEVVPSLKDSLISGGVINFLEKTDNSVIPLQIELEKFYRDRSNFQMKMKKAFNDRMKVLGGLSGRIKKIMKDDNLDQLGDKIDSLKYDKDY